jgi:hypothetical protein
MLCQKYIRKKYVHRGQILLRSDRYYQRQCGAPSLARRLFCPVPIVLLVVKQRRLILLHLGCNKKNELLFPMLGKMNVHVVSNCQGLLQHTYPLLYMHLSHVKTIGLIATTFNSILSSVLDFRFLKRHRSWSEPGSRHNVRVWISFGHGPNDTITN